MCRRHVRLITRRPGEVRAGAESLSPTPSRSQHTNQQHSGTSGSHRPSANHVQATERWGDRKGVERSRTGPGLEWQPEVLEGDATDSPLRGPLPTHPPQRLLVHLRLAPQSLRHENYRHGRGARPLQNATRTTRATEDEHVTRGMPGARWLAVAAPCANPRRFRGERGKRLERRGSRRLPVIFVIGKAEVTCLLAPSVRCAARESARIACPRAILFMRSLSQWSDSSLHCNKKQYFPLAFYSDLLSIHFPDNKLSIKGKWDETTPLSRDE